MNWILAGLLANVAIQATEYINRHWGDGTWWSVLPMTVPLIAVAQWALFVGFRGAPHWMAAWAAFSLGNSLMRVALVYLTGQPIGSWPYVLGGVTIMLAGGLVLKEGLA